MYHFELCFDSQERYIVTLFKIKVILFQFMQTLFIINEFLKTIVQL